ncbi:MAG: pyruvate formate lyase family protein [Christensenellaceae bacterium]
MENIKFVIEKSARIDKLIDELYAKMPEIESARGVLVTESYKATEALPIINRRSAAFAHILRNIPIIIRDGELIVGSATLAPHGCQVFPIFLRMAGSGVRHGETRAADPFISAKESGARRLSYGGQDVQRPGEIEHSARGLRAFTVPRHVYAELLLQRYRPVNVIMRRCSRATAIIAEAQAALKLDVMSRIRASCFLSAVVEAAKRR